ncbi:hypothetical protein [Vulcanibacillus modesticaldus]|nr:hypothetical protein [Vulcanibacillus modesticaldus]
MNENSTTGIFEVESKVREGNYYYINLGDIKIRCTQNEFNLISINQKYLITYTWNNYSPGKGKLINIQH